MAKPPAEEPVDLEEKCKEQEEEISKLRECLAIIGSGQGDVREAKIIELCKKNRILNLQLERERTRNNNTKKAMAIMQHELLIAQQPKMDENAIQEGLNYWVDKFHRTNRMLEKTQAKRSRLEKDVQRLQYVLRREVGDHIPLEKVIEEGTGWVGRSELISKLKGKVEELKAQVYALQPAPLEGYKTYKNDERRVVEILHKNELEKHDNERRMQYEKLVHEFVTLRASWTMQKKRLDGMISRRNILEKEIRAAKARMQILLTKSINDDLLIQALTIELAATRQGKGPPFPKPGGPLQLDHHARCHKLAASFHELKSQCHEQEVTLRCQESIIQNFTDTIADTSCGDWVTSETGFTLEEDRSPIDDGTKSPPLYHECVEFV